MSLQGKIAPRGTSFKLSGRPYFKLFERPAAWWDYESPESRKLLSGDPSGAFPERGLFKGKPNSYKSLKACNELIYESEKSYLIRLNLLNDIERRLLVEEK
jgi:hypothetical protein